MKAYSRILVPALLLLAPVVSFGSDEVTSRTPAEIFAATLQKLVSVIEPAPGSDPRTLSVRLECVKAEGLPKELAGQEAMMAFQAPDRLTVSVDVGYKGKAYAAGRDQQQIWVHVADKKFGVVGKPGQARFASAPEKKDTTRLPPFKFPLPREQVVLLPLLMKIEALPDQTVDKALCHVLTAVPKPETIEALKVPKGTLTLWVRDSDNLPAR